MKKLIVSILILLISFSIFAADENSREISRSQYAYANITFTANLYSIFGFSNSPVDSAVQPDKMEGEIEFKYIGNNIIQTDLFYVYYQIFTPDNVEVSLHVESGNNTPSNTQISWENISGDMEFSSDNTSDSACEVYRDSNNLMTHTQPRIGSKPLILQIKKLNDISWDEKYDWKLVMTIKEVK